MAGVAFCRPTRVIFLVSVVLAEELVVTVDSVLLVASPGEFFLPFIVERMGVPLARSEILIVQIVHLNVLKYLNFKSLNF